MARRKNTGRPEEAPVPEVLCRFVAGEWPGSDPWGEWTAARRAWLAEHGDETPLGDTVDVIKGEIEAKRRRSLAGGA